VTFCVASRYSTFTSHRTLVELLHETHLGEARYAHPARKTSSQLSCACILGLRYPLCNAPNSGTKKATNGLIGAPRTRKSKTKGYQSRVGLLEINRGHFLFLQFEMQQDAIKCIASLKAIRLCRITLGLASAVERIHKILAFTTREHL
jgi:hypothetical protein